MVHFITRFALGAGILSTIAGLMVIIGFLWHYFSIEADPTIVIQSLIGLFLFGLLSFGIGHIVLDD